MLSHSAVFNSFATSWTVACQAPLSMGFPGKPFPSAGDFPGRGKIRDHVAEEAERNHCLCNVTFPPLAHSCVCVLSCLRCV